MATNAELTVETQKISTQNSELKSTIRQLSGRLSSMSDEIAVLKGELNSFRQMVTEDMTRLVTAVEQNR